MKAAAPGGTWARCKACSTGRGRSVGPAWAQTLSAAKPQARAGRKRDRRQAQHAKSTEGTESTEDTEGAEDTKDAVGTGTADGTEGAGDATSAKGGSMR